MSEFADPLYKNWVRSALSLKYLKEGLYGFVDRLAKQHHNNLLQRFTKITGSPAVSCTECTSENLLPDHPRHGCIQKFKSKCFCYNGVGRRKCPYNFCSKLYDLIVIAHAERNPLWINSDPRKWYSDHWEIAKCYLSSTGYSEQGTAEETDAAGLLSIILNIIEVRVIRNEIMHSKAFQVDQSSLYQYIDQIILVLQDSRTLVTDVAAQNAVIKLEKLKKDQIYICLEDGFVMKRQALRALKDEAIQQIKANEEKMYRNLVSHIDDQLQKQTKELKFVERLYDKIEIKRKQLIDRLKAYFESESEEIFDPVTVNSGLEDEKVKIIKTFDYLADKNRLIVAGKYLNKDNIAFVDRKNSFLIVTNTEDQSFKEIDLVQLLPEQYRAQNPKNIPNPSDVNKGFEDDQILITYTGKDFSLAIACRLDNMIQLGPALHVVRIHHRTRSVVAIDKDNVCATTEYKIIIKNKDDNGDAEVRSHPRVTRDKGGLLMTDGKGNIYYGDGVSFVGCSWDGKNIKEKFRLGGDDKYVMQFARGCAINPNSGRIFVCTDSSRAIFSHSSDGSNVRMVVDDKWKQYGDIDFNSDGNRFFTTFWCVNEWPILYGL